MLWNVSDFLQNFHVLKRIKIYKNIKIYESVKRKLKNYRVQATN